MVMRKIYFNTTNIDGNELFKAIEGAENQNKKVLAIFKALNRPISPTQLEEIYLEFTGSPIPRSSVARALNTLTNTGELIKTNKHRLSKFKRREYLWIRNK